MKLLAMANGYRTTQHEIWEEELQERWPVKIGPGGRGATWSLPAVGAAPEQLPVVGNVRQLVTLKKVGWGGAWDGGPRVRWSVGGWVGGGGTGRWESGEKGEGRWGERDFAGAKWYRSIRQLV